LWSLIAQIEWVVNKPHIAYYLLNETMIYKWL